MFNLPTTNFNKFQELLNVWKTNLLEDPDNPDEWQYVTPPIGALVLPKLTGDCFWWDCEQFPHNQEAQEFTEMLQESDFPCVKDGEYNGLLYHHSLYVFNLSLGGTPYLYQGHPVTKVLQLTYNVSTAQGMDMYFIFTE